jgi:hypothetical protein
LIIAQSLEKGNARIAIAPILHFCQKRFGEAAENVTGNPKEHFSLPVKTAKW